MTQDLYNTEQDWKIAQLVIGETMLLGDRIVQKHPGIFIAGSDVEQTLRE